MRERANVLERFVARVAAVGVDRELDVPAYRGAHLLQHPHVELPALAALDLERAHAVFRAGVGRLHGHARRRLPRDHEGHLDLVPAAPELPQRLSGGRRAQRPAGVVDQRLREAILRDPGERRFHRFGVREVDMAQERQHDVLERHRERARRITRARGLDDAFGDAARAVVGDEAKQRVVAGVFGAVHPLDVADVGQPVKVQRPFAELHAAYSEAKRAAFLLLSGSTPPRRGAFEP
jgi:hypothetical protein